VENQDNKVKETARRLYRLIDVGCLTDDSNGTQDKVNIIRRLEEITGQEFKNTEDFHAKMKDYFKSDEKQGKKLHDFRQERRWSLATLGAYIGVSRQFAYQMERGRKPLNDKALQIIGVKT
jgi:DNA-binding XRE family transcriptional regulator